jgi:hypothetical protein
MGNREQISFKEDDNLTLENKKEEEGRNREKIISAILDLKDKIRSEPDGVNMHLKNIDRNLLFTSLEEEDYEAFDKVFNNEWDESSDGYKEYVEKELEWEGREKMDSGKSPKLLVRRDFATMMRAYFMSKYAEEKNEEKDLNK